MRLGTKWISKTVFEHQDSFIPKSYYSRTVLLYVALLQIINSAIQGHLFFISNTFVPPYSSLFVVCQQYGTASAAFNPFPSLPLPLPSLLRLAVLRGATNRRRLNILRVGAELSPNACIIPEREREKLSAQGKKKGLRTIITLTLEYTLSSTFIQEV